jgi:hypothetical protein
MVDTPSSGTTTEDSLRRAIKRAAKPKRAARLRLLLRQDVEQSPSVEQLVRLMAEAELQRQRYHWALRALQAEIRRQKHTQHAQPHRGAETEQ